MHGGSHRDMHSHMDTQTCIDVNGHTGRGQRRPHSDWDWGCKTSVPCHPATAEHFISALLQEATYKSAERLYLIQRNLTPAGCTHETRRPLAMMRRQKKKKNICSSRDTNHRLFCCKATSLTGTPPRIPVQNNSDIHLSDGENIQRSGSQNRERIPLVVHGLA